MLLIRLCKGSCNRADGAAVNLWKVGLQFWKHGKKPIPKEVFETLEDHDLLLAAKLVKISGESALVTGSEEQFNWLFERVEAGRAGANKTNELLAAKRRQATANERPPTPTPSPTHDIISKKVTKKVQLHTPEGVTERRDLLAFWLVSYEQAKGCPYHEPKSAKTNGQIKNLHERLGLDEAKRLMVAYLQINKPFYVSRGHDLGTFQVDLAGVQTFAANPVKAIKDAKLFAVQKEAIEHESTTLHERSQVYRTAENLRHGGTVQQLVSSQTNGQVPERVSSAFERELLTGRGADDIPDCDF